MSTPGRRKALKALAARKRVNRQRIAAGKAPVIGGKKVSAAEFAAKTSTTVGAVKKSIAKAKKKRKKKG